MLEILGEGRQLFNRQSKYKQGTSIKKRRPTQSLKRQKKGGVFRMILPGSTPKENKQEEP